MASPNVRMDANAAARSQSAEEAASMRQALADCGDLNAAAPKSACPAPIASMTAIHAFPSAPACMALQAAAGRVPKSDSASIAANLAEPLRAASVAANAASGENTRIWVAAGPVPVECHRRTASAAGTAREGSAYSLTLADSHASANPAAIAGRNSGMNAPVPAIFEAQAHIRQE